MIRLGSLWLSLHLEVHLSTIDLLESGDNYLLDQVPLHRHRGGLCPKTPVGSGEPLGPGRTRGPDCSASVWPSQLHYSCSFVASFSFLQDFSFDFASLRGLVPDFLGLSI